jgi:hypothetical protein
MLLYVVKQKYCLANTVEKNVSILLYGLIVIVSTIASISSLERGIILEKYVKSLLSIVWSSFNLILVPVLSDIGTGVPYFVVFDQAVVCALVCLKCFLFLLLSEVNRVTLARQISKNKIPMEAIQTYLHLVFILLLASGSPNVPDIFQSAQASFCFPDAY